MMWTDTPCRITCWNCGNETIIAERNPKIEFIVAQHPWLENDCLYADIILPTNTNMEVDDIVTNTRQGTQHHSVILLDKAIEPVGESKSDYEAVLEVAKKMGKGEEFTEGKTIRDLQKEVFDNMGLDKLITWEEFEKNSTWSCRRPKDWENDVVGLRPFYDDPEKQPPAHAVRQAGVLLRPDLAKHFPDDEERPPIPKWVEKSAMHDERRRSWRAKATRCCSCPTTVAGGSMPRPTISPGPVKWSPARSRAGTATCTSRSGSIPPTLKTAASRWATSSRSTTSAASCCAAPASGSESCPGVAYVDHGARHDPIIPGKVDRGGAINTISGDWITSKNAASARPPAVTWWKSAADRRDDGAVETRVSRSL